VCYLQFRVRVIYAGRIEKRPVAHEELLFIIHAQIYAFVRELLTVQRQWIITDIIMLKFVPVAVQRTDKICFLNYGEQQIFGVGHRTALSTNKDFDPAENVNALSSTLVRL